SLGFRYNLLSRPKTAFRLLHSLQARLFSRLVLFIVGYPAIRLFPGHGAVPPKLAVAPRGDVGELFLGPYLSQLSYSYSYLHFALAHFVAGRSETGAGLNCSTTCTLSRAPGLNIVHGDGGQGLLSGAPGFKQSRLGRITR